MDVDPNVLPLVRGFFTPSNCYRSLTSFRMTYISEILLAITFFLYCEYAEITISTLRFFALDSSSDPFFRGFVLPNPFAVILSARMP